jgi:hypothetical protein
MSPPPDATRSGSSALIVLNEPRPTLHVGLGDGGRVKCPAGIRDEHRDVLVLDRCRQKVDTDLVGHVEFPWGDARVRFGQLVESIHPTCRGNDVEPALGERDRRGGPDAAARPGHYGRAAVAHGCSLLLDQK